MPGVESELGTGAGTAHGVESRGECLCWGGVEGLGGGRGFANRFRRRMRSCAMCWARGDSVGAGGVVVIGVVGDEVVGVFEGEGVGGGSICRRLRENLFLWMSRSCAMRCSRRRRGDVVGGDGVGIRGG